MSKPTVVIIDDDRSFVEAVSIFLERRGYCVVRASSGQEGLARLRENRVNVGIIDVHLPDMSGIDVAEQLREANTMLPIILISSDHRPEVLKACQETGAKLFLAKPIGPDELLNALSDTLEG